MSLARGRALIDVGRIGQALGKSPEIVKKLAREAAERTFGWLMQCRRLVRDYKRTVQSATGWIHMAMIRIMLRRLA